MPRQFITKLPVFVLRHHGEDFQVFFSEEEGGISIFSLYYEGYEIEYIPQVENSPPVHLELITRIEQVKERIINAMSNQFPDDWDTYENACSSLDTMYENIMNSYADALGNVVLLKTEDYPPTGFEYNW